MSQPKVTACAPCFPNQVVHRVELLLSKLNVMRTLIEEVVEYSSRKSKYVSVKPLFDHFTRAEELVLSLTTSDHENVKLTNDLLKQFVHIKVALDAIINRHWWHVRVIDRYTASDPIPALMAVQDPILSKKKVTWSTTHQQLAIDLEDTVTDAYILALQLSTFFVLAMARHRTQQRLQFLRRIKNNLGMFLLALDRFPWFNKRYLTKLSEFDSELRLRILQETEALDCQVIHLGKWDLRVEDLFPEAPFDECVALMEQIPDDIVAFLACDFNLTEAFNLVSQWRLHKQRHWTEKLAYIKAITNRVLRRPKDTPISNEMQNYLVAPP